ncbi:hypothetical protein ACJZ2D_001215 [Fusarium nematophilum]
MGPAWSPPEDENGEGEAMSEERERSEKRTAMTAMTATRGSSFFLRGQAKPKSRDKNPRASRRDQRQERGSDSAALHRRSVFASRIRQSCRYRSILCSSSLLGFAESHSAAPPKRAQSSPSALSPLAQLSSRPQHGCVSPVIIGQRGDAGQPSAASRG